MKRRRFFLVYQAGIANVFEVKSLNLANYGRDAKRVYQADFRTAEAVAYGLGFGGHIVKIAHCNMAGDIVNQPWSENMDDAPFRDSMNYRGIETS